MVADILRGGKSAQALIPGERRGMMLGHEARDTPLKLVIVHYHLRPGGIRRVMELAAPGLRSALPGLHGVCLVSGEAAEAAWMKRFRAALPGIAVEAIIDPALGYFSEWPGDAAAQEAAVQSALAGLGARVGEAGALVWMHNASVGRNFILTRHLTTLCQAQKWPLIFHQHDWWFDNRWKRWDELKAAGLRTIKEAAALLFPPALPSSVIRHFTINQPDTALLQSGLGEGAAWLPNPIADYAPANPARVKRARRWLAERIGDASAPVWILPCRLLRRKNVAEALLLTRLLRPGAWLITTGAPSSREEQPYAERLQAAATAGNWPLRLSVLAAAEVNAPRVEELIGASEAVLLTSLQEGFGLPYLEAAFGQRPLVGRMLRNIAPDLAAAGLQFPQIYDELLVHPSLFDWIAERARQRVLISAWKKSMPSLARALVEIPRLLKPAATTDEPLPFSRLTLTAQLEVLAHPPDVLWESCAEANPFLAPWRAVAEAGTLSLATGQEQARAELSVARYAQRFAEALARPPAAAPDLLAAEKLQADFMRARLQEANLYPLLWSSET